MVKVNEQLWFGATLLLAQPPPLPSPVVEFAGTPPLLFSALRKIEVGLEVLLVTVQVMVAVAESVTIIDVEAGTMLKSAPA